MTDRPAGPPDPDLVSLVVPLYNETESLRSLFAEIDSAVKTGLVRAEIIFVDDGSTDDSWAVVAELAAVDPRVRGVRFRRNFGKAPALRAGFAVARGGIVVTLDADLQDDPAELPRFLAAIRGGLDVVSGWKKIRHDPWHKVLPSRLFNAVVSRVTGVTLHDHNCGFKAYRASVIREVMLYGERHRFVPVLAAARGFQVGELIIHHRARKYGHSKFGIKRFLRGFLDLLTVSFLTVHGYRPLHLFGTPGLFAILLSITGGLVLVGNLVLQLVFDFGAGPAAQIVGTILIVGLFLFGSLMFVAGLLAELIVDRGHDHPPYAIAETTK